MDRACCDDNTAVPDDDVTFLNWYGRYIEGRTAFPGAQPDQEEESTPGAASSGAPPNQEDTPGAASSGAQPNQEEENLPENHPAAYLSGYGAWLPCHLALGIAQNPHRAFADTLSATFDPAEAEPDAEPSNRSRQVRRLPRKT